MWFLFLALRLFAFAIVAVSVLGFAWLVVVIVLERRAPGRSALDVALDTQVPEQADRTHPRKRVL